MITMLKRLLCAALCAALVICTLTTALADGTAQPSVDGSTVIDARTGGKASTNFKVLTYSDFSILSATEDFVMAVGASETLMVRVNGVEPITYDWKVSADGGATWSATLGTAAYYEITDAQANDHEQQPYTYIYRVTVDDASSVPSLSRDITVLVSDDYQYKTIALESGSVNVSAYMHNDTRLVITPLSDSAADAIAMESELSPGCLPLLVCDVVLVNGNDQVMPYFGTLALGFDVGTVYDGQTLRVFHLHNGNILTYSGVVTNGKLTITVSALSPFMVEVPAAGTHAVTVSAGSGGSISPSGTVYVSNGGGMYFYFIPNTGYVVDKLLLDGAETAVTGNSYQLVNVTADRTVRVTFKRSTAPSPPVSYHTITAGADENGVISPAGAVYVPSGGSQAFYFRPNSGYAVDTVTVDGAIVDASGNTYRFADVTFNHTILVTFKKTAAPPVPAVYHTIAASAGANGSVSPAGDVLIREGDTQTFSFIPDAGHAVDTVTVDGRTVAADNGSYSFEAVDSDHTIHVTFKEAPAAPVPTVYHTVSVSVNGNGSISPSGDVLVANGGSQTFYLIPDDGYEVEAICVNGIKQDVAGNQFTVENISGGIELAVTFKPQSVPVSSAASHCFICGWFGGSIAPWCWLTPVIIAAVLGGVLWFFLRKRRG